MTTTNEHTAPTKMRSMRISDPETTRGSRTGGMDPRKTCPLVTYDSQMVPAARMSSATPATPSDQRSPDQVKRAPIGGNMRRPLPESNRDGVGDKKEAFR